MRALGQVERLLIIKKVSTIKGFLWLMIFEGCFWIFLPKSRAK